MRVSMHSRVSVKALRCAISDEIRMHNPTTLAQKKIKKSLAICQTTNKTCFSSCQHHLAAQFFSQV